MTTHQPKIEKLIAELCPNGVEFKELDEVAKIYDGTHNTPKYTNEGIPFVSVENIRSIYSTNKYITLADYEKNYKIKPRIGDVFMTRIGIIGTCALVSKNDDLAYYVTLALIRPDTKKILPNYLKHVIESDIGKKELRKRTLVNAVPIKINLGEIGKLQIPLPPLPIQQEIVDILDKFTQLEAELEAELEARKRQYEYYRASLFLNNKNPKIKTLGEVCYISSGGTPSKAKKEYWENGDIPWIKSESCRNESIHVANSFITSLGLRNSSAKLLSNETTLIALVGATIFKTAFLEFEASTNQNIASIKSRDNLILNDKFVFYYLTSLYSTLKSNMKDYGMLNLTTLRSFKIPIPSLQEQQRIVSILDKFDTLVNDISIGLPAEIQARRQQYEYYRNKLLTFKELKK